MRNGRGSKKANLSLYSFLIAVNPSKINHCSVWLSLRYRMGVSGWFVAFNVPSWSPASFCKGCHPHPFAPGRESKPQSCWQCDIQQYSACLCCTSSLNLFSFWPDFGQPYKTVSHCSHWIRMATAASPKDADTKAGRSITCSVLGELDGKMPFFRGWKS